MQAGRGLHAGEVAEAFGRGHSGTAVHLKELERAGLAISANNGHATFFRPDRPALQELVASLEAVLGRRTVEGDEAEGRDVTLGEGVVR